jgi:hypothetical protein
MAHIGYMRGAYRFVVGGSEEKGPLENLGVDARTILK